MEKDELTDEREGSHGGSYAGFWPSITTLPTQLIIQDPAELQSPSPEGHYWAPLLLKFLQNYIWVSQSYSSESCSHFLMSLGTSPRRSLHYHPKHTWLSLCNSFSHWPAVLLSVFPCVILSSWNVLSLLNVRSQLTCLCWRVIRPTA